MTLYLARYLLPVAAPPLEDGAMLVRDGRIAAVGRRRDLQRGWNGPTVDFADGVLLPPLVNAHTHLELTRFPAWAEAAGEESEPKDFVDWILHLIRVKRRQNPAELYRSLEEGLQKSLQAGTGAAGDILSFPAALAAYRTSPLRGRVFLEVLGLDPERVRGSLEQMEKILASGPVGFLEPGLAPHSPYTLSAGATAQVRAAATGRPLTIHFAESVDEGEFLQGAAGAIAERLYPAVGWEGWLPRPQRLGPAQWLDALGLLNLKPLLVHGVQATREDAELLARSGATLVLCPRSNARLGVGRAPVEDYRAAGVPLALGTDSLASCSSLSLWDELAFAAPLFGDYLNPCDLLAMATVNGARALGLQGEMGALAPGWGAHFQVLKLAAPPRFVELEDFLCHRGGDLAGGYLFLGGRQVL